MSEFIEVEWADLHEYFAEWEDHSEELWEQRQRRDVNIHARINDRGNQLDWAIAEQELRTAYIKGQHTVYDDLPF
jgi:hypothetical protein